MAISKAWDWNLEKNGYWMEPCEESCWLADRWLKAGFRQVLDLGCGLGRHAIYFARRGMDVSAFDLSTEGTDHVRAWKTRENLKVDVQIGDMLALPYGSDSFDAIFAYHVISHTDTAGARQVISEIIRVLRPAGEVYLTLCSKDSPSFHNADFPKIDENSVMKTDEGPEKGVPHFYADLEDVLAMFKDFCIIRIRYINDCYFNSQKHDSIHYYIHAKGAKTS
jgi:SAM-dependent methyltransferase